MKRMTLNIDLKENEVFEKEIEEIIRAKVRGVIRTEFGKVVGEESKKEVERLFKADTYGYRDKLKDLVKSAASSDIRKAIEEQDIVGLTKEKISEIVEYKVNYYSDIVDEKCKKVLDAKITVAVEEKLKKILG